MSEAFIPELTDERVAEVAAKFGITPERVREQWAIAVQQGPDAVLTEMNERISEVETEINEIVDDASARWLRVGDRLRNIADFYKEGWDAMSVDEISEASVSDMFLKMAVLVYLLAEARQNIATLTDSSHRRGEG